jgi:hypothetical protein
LEDEGRGEDNGVIRISDYISHYIIPNQPREGKGRKEGSRLVRYYIMDYVMYYCIGGLN